MQVNGVSSTNFTGYFPLGKNINNVAQKMGTDESWNHLRAALDLSKTKHVDLYVKADKNGNLDYFVSDKLGMTKYEANKSVLKQFKPYMTKESFNQLKETLFNKALSPLDKAVAVTKSIDSTFDYATCPRRVDTAEDFKDILWNNVK